MRRRALMLFAACTVLAALYLAVIRDLQVFRIESVKLSGAGSAYSGELRADLVEAARGMTTLHVRDDELREVARRYPAVVELEADAHPLHRLTVRVTERPPVGVIDSARGRRTPVARDGTLLKGLSVDRPLPVLPGRAAQGERSPRSSTVQAARLAAGAPPALAAWLSRVRRGAEGWVVELRDGPELRFGTLRNLRAKWSAATAVLAARSARGAEYVDLRLPDRPAAGGLPPELSTAPGTDRGASEAGSGATSNPQPQVDTFPEP